MPIYPFTEDVDSVGVVLDWGIDKRIGHAYLSYYGGDPSIGMKDVDSVGAVLDWGIDRWLLESLVKNGSYYNFSYTSTCKDTNTSINSTIQSPIVQCSCNPGFEGNPYISGICQEDTAYGSYRRKIKAKRALDGVLISLQVLYKKPQPPRCPLQEIVYIEIIHPSIKSPFVLIRMGLSLHISIVPVIMMVVSLQVWLPLGCFEEERNALLQLKDSLNYPNGTSLPSWRKGDARCCDWGGVFCNSSIGRVIELNLWGVRNGQLGDWYLNASLFLPFQELNYLHLRDNQIAGWVENKGLLSD
ncbi:hypothetical protein DKX38_028670 [Salix brachista]|uniref:Leucine-rich repeat-containing N-terminal plant-type domain-containing protein n=1 Tax=Salix brachista TaxID=2182728 RepID=A0A5N5J9U6_9ROSI|nr:hypothetical protein DKX38_028670 [Salix brachista]